MVDTARKRDIIAENYHKVIEQIQNAANKSGRNPQDIRLVVVTKTQPVDVILSLIETGAMDFGENYIEEAIPKIQAFSKSEGLRWHMIGHIQSRKAESVCDYFQYVHSLDSVKLAGRLCRSAQMLDKKLPVWMEFNVSGEESKFGWDISAKENWDSVLADIEKIRDLPNLDLLGVMTVPPYSEEAEESRPLYRKLRSFQECVIDRLRMQNFREMSIGMSNDFEVAIEEGATCVRIGREILGPRQG